MVAVMRKGVDGTAAQKSKQQSKRNPLTVEAESHETAGELLIFLQQAEWQLHHQGVDITGKLTVCTANPSGLGQRGHETSWASCV